MDTLPFKSLQLKETFNVFFIKIIFISTFLLSLSDNFISTSNIEDIFECYRG